MRRLRREARLVRSSAIVIGVVLLAGACSGGDGGASGGGSSPPGSGRAPGQPEIIVGDAASAPVVGAVGSWAGTIADTNAFVAVVSDGRQVMAYVCDSNEVGQWFRADLTGNEVTAFNAEGWALQLRLDAKAVTGSVSTPDDESVAFDLPATSGEASLYRAREELEDSTLLAGWIVLPDGQQRGSLTISSRTRTAPGASAPITPAPVAPIIKPAPPIAPAPGSPLTPVTVQLPDRVITTQPNPVTTEALTAGTPNKPFEFVMVTLGDSYAAGEGAPNVSGEFDAGGQLPSGKKKETWSQQPPNHPDVEACHRSDLAAGPQVAADLEAEFPDVRIIHQSFACSGAKIENIRNTTYPGADGHVNNVTVPPQVLQIQNWFKKTGPVSFPGTVEKIDFLIMNIGGNDAGFGDVIGACIGPFTNCTEDTAMHNSVQSSLDGLTAKYDNLGATLRTLAFQRTTGQNVSIAPGRIFITSVPNPLRDQDGELCHGPDSSRMQGEMLNELTRNESEWAEANVVGPLNSAITQAANRNQWTLVPGVSEHFRTHGICSNDPWINNVRDSLRRQGEDVRLDGFGAFVNTTPLVNLSAGMVHPNAAGFRAVADKAIETVRPRFVTQWTPAPPGRLRVGSATRNGNIEMRWDDQSNNEQRFELEQHVLQPDGSFVGPFTDTIAADRQSATIVANSAWTARYRVRACGPKAGDALCSAWSDPVVGSNQPPREPANVAGAPHPTGVTGSFRVAITFVDQAGVDKPGGPGAIVAVLSKGSDERQYIVRPATSASTTVLAGPAPSDVFPAGEWRLVLRACNPAACSEAQPVTVNLSTGGGPAPTTSTTRPRKFNTTTTLAS